MDIIFGLHAIIEAIEAGKTIDKLMLKKDLSGDLARELINLARERDITVQRVPIEKLKSQTRTIKISVRNAPHGVRMLLFPSDVVVSYRSPVSRISDNDSGITAVVDYNSVDFNSSSNKVIGLIGEMPSAYQDVKLSQDSVEYILEKSK